MHDCTVCICKREKAWKSVSQTEIHMKHSVFWDITPYSPLKVNQYFGGICCFHLSGPKNKQGEKPGWSLFYNPEDRGNTPSNSICRYIITQKFIINRKSVINTVHTHIHAMYTYKYTFCNLPIFYLKLIIMFYLYLHFLSLLYLIFLFY